MATSNSPTRGQVKFPHLGRQDGFELICELIRRFTDGKSGRGLFETVAFSLELEHGPAVHEAVHDGAGGDVVAEEFSPVRENAV